jgi:hypothetical protein
MWLNRLRPRFGLGLLCLLYLLQLWRRSLAAQRLCWLGFGHEVFLFPARRKQVEVGRFETQPPIGAIMSTQSHAFRCGGLERSERLVNNMYAAEARSRAGSASTIRTRNPKNENEASVKVPAGHRAVRLHAALVAGRWNEATPSGLPAGESVRGGPEGSDRSRVRLLRGEIRRTAR